MPEWCKHSSDEIIGIKMEDESPPWQSSPPPPEVQLQDLLSKGFVGEFKDYERDERLAELVEGKRIAYVCPSPHLIGEGTGNLIDSYDLVARVNQNRAMLESQWNDCGRRTDILFNCVNILKLNALFSSRNTDYVRDLKFLINPTLSMWDIERQEHPLKLMEHYFGIPWQNISDGHVFKIFKEVGTTVNTGLLGIITLLNYDIKELYVTGMTFFNMNSFGRVYTDEYHDDAVEFGNFGDTPDKSPTPESLRMDIHYQEPQIKYFQKIVDHYSDSCLTLDSYLTENFIESRQ